MKRILLALLLLSQVCFAQFPVNVDKYNSSATSLQDILKIDGKLETGILGSASVALPLSPGANVIGFATVYTQGGGNWFIEDFSVYSNKDAVLTLLVNNIAGIGGRGLFISHRFTVKADQTITIPWNDIVPYGATFYMQYVSSTVTTGTLDLYATYKGYKFSQTGNHFAKKVAKFIGDSITELSGDRDHDDPNKGWPMQVTLAFKKAGNDIKPVNKAMSGLLAEEMATASKWGYLHSTHSSITYIMLGMNLSANLTAYTNAITQIVTTEQYDNPKSQIVVIKPTVTTDAPREATLATYRAALTTLIPTLNAARPAGSPAILLIDGSAAYTVAELAAAGGDGVHPPQSLVNQLATYVINNAGPSVITSLNQ